MYKNMSSELNVAFNWSLAWSARLWVEEKRAIIFSDDNAGAGIAVMMQQPELH